MKSPTAMWLCAGMLAFTVAAEVGVAQTSKPQTNGRAAQPAGQRARGAGAATPARGSAGANPHIVFETVKGTFEVELYAADAPKSVEHIITLAKRNFYNGLRVHRVVSGFVVQFGDPQTRDMTKRAQWGRGDSGRAIGVAEISPKRPHKLGAVALAYGKDPREADSQIYIALAGVESAQIRNINGKYAVIGQVISGMDVVRKLQETDIIRRATVK